MRTRRMRWSSGVLAAIMLVVAPVTASATREGGPSGGQQYAAEENNPHVSSEVMDNLPDVIKNDPGVYIAPEITTDTVFLYPDGSLVEGQSSADAEFAALNCGATFSAGLGGHYVRSTSNCAVFGHDGYYINYAWNYGIFGPAVSMRVKGYLYPGPYEAWRDAGVYNPGGYRIHWGNVAAYPEVAGASVSPFGSNVVAWRH